MLSANVVRKTVNQATARWGVRAYAIILNGKEYVVGYFFFNFKTQKISQRGSAATCARAAEDAARQSVPGLVVRFQRSTRSARPGAA